MWRHDPWTPVRAVAHWPVTTQIGARRNALVASTDLAQRRRERHDVEEFLRTLNQPERRPQTAGDKA
jgi:hypothetical protein